MSNITGKISNINKLNGNVTSKNQLSGSLSSSANLSGNIMYTILKGLSAYEVAVDNGFVGTEEEWLESLIGNGIESAELNSNGYLIIHYTDGTTYTSPTSLKGTNGHSPYISNNGHWFIYDDEAGEYIDSGKTSIVIIGEGLVADPVTGAISVDTDTVNDRMDYEKLKKKPQIESVELIGNKKFTELGISPIEADDLLEILI